jgi:hypothetical protein
MQTFARSSSRLYGGRFFSLTIWRCSYGRFRPSNIPDSGCTTERMACKVSRSHRSNRKA